MTIALGVLVASLLGSVHCVAMCGGFVCLYATTPGEWKSHAAYNGGRLVAYLTLGVVAGTLGGALDLAGTLVGIARSAATVSGVLLMCWGAYRLFGAAGIRRVRPASASFAPMLRLQSRVLARTREQRPAVRGAVVGLVSGLLPCGWLYVFVATAAGMGGVGGAALTMLMFWLGTLPAMTTAGLVLQRATGSLRARLPALSAVLILVIGALTLAGRLTPALGPAQRTSPRSDVHAHPG